MKLLFSILTIALFNVFVIAAPKQTDPFFPDVTYADGTLTVAFAMNDTHQHIYDDMFECSLGTPSTKPVAQTDSDSRLIYEGYATFTWSASVNQTFTLDYQGCDITQCYMPQHLTFTILPSGNVIEGTPNENDTASSSLAEPLTKASERSISGYIPATDFLSFLQGKTSVTTTDDNTSSLFENPQEWVATHGYWLLIGLIFIFGIALNLTPCVLPMMPINLAIIGAGAAGESRLKGALRGGAYGLGIALAYGVLALIPVLTGTAFGTLQSTWWFNTAIALIFVALALALLDVFMIDFTRFAGAGSGKQGTIAAFIAGAISALLAGACVAPILIVVLLLTTNYVAEGAYWALCLPFVLGLGMAFPWPIAGAGLSFLPKPGAWMLWIKKIFAIIVFLFAAHYGWTAIKTLLPHDGLNGADLPAIGNAIANAQAAQKPILLDFWGPSCKACDKMEASTLKDAEIVEELKRFEVVKVRIDLADREAIAPTQKRFGIQGLPTFIIIE